MPIAHCIVLTRNYYRFIIKLFIEKCIIWLIIYKNITNDSFTRILLMTKNVQIIEIHL